MPAPKKNEFNSWVSIPNISGNQMNPAVAAQLMSQAENQMSEEQPIGVPPAPDLTSMFTAAPPEMMTPMPSLTKQPTRQKTGELPAEIKPEQKPLMSDDNNIYAEQLMQMAQGMTYRPNYKLMQALEMGDKSYNEKLMLQQSEVDKLKGQLAQYMKQEKGTDFRPMAALVDDMFGGGGVYSKAAQAMAPESDAERVQRMNEMQTKIAAAQGGISQAELEGLKNRLAQMGYMDERELKAQMSQLAAMGMAAKASGSDFLDERKAAKIERQTLQYGKEIGSQSQELYDNIKNLEEGLGFKLDDVDEKTGRVAGKKVDIPGISIPIYGRANVTSEASDLYSKFAPIFNTTLRNQSGMAVTNAELERLKEQFAMGKFNTEASLIAAAKRFRNAAARKLKSIETSYSKDVLNQIRDQGGSTVSEFFPTVGGGADRDFDLGGKTLPSSNSGLSPQQKTRLEELRAKRGK